jgi:hypothetical protein
VISWSVIVNSVHEIRQVRVTGIALIVHIDFRTFLVADTRMLSRYREWVFAIELELCKDDPKWLAWNLTFDRPVHDIIRNIRDISWEFLAGDHFIRFWEWRLVVRPIESLSLGFFSWERIHDHIHRLVVAEVTIASGDEFSPFSGFSHMRDDLWNELLVFFFGILLIEYAIRGISESDTAEAIMDIVHAVCRVIYIRCMCPYTDREIHLTRVFTYLLSFVDSIYSISPEIIVHGEMGSTKSFTITDIFRVVDDARVGDIFGVKYSRWVADTLRSNIIYSIATISGSREKFLYSLILLVSRHSHYNTEFLMILCLGVLDIVDIVLFILDTMTSVAVLAAVTVVEKCWGMTVLHIKREMHIITSSSVEELITVMTIIYTQAVDAVGRVTYIDRIEAIFTTTTIEYEVAVFEITTVIGVERVLHRLRYRLSWHRDETL